MASILPDFTFDQSHRPLKIKTPLGEKALLLGNLSGQETVSAPFHFDLSLLSEQGDLELKELVGKAMGITMETAKGEHRHFHGYVWSFANTGSDGGVSFYHADLVPWTQFLTQRTNCRIFQDVTAIDIVKTLFGEYGALADFEVRTSKTYAKRTLCVQYNESDFNFVSRLLEAEGAFYFFEFKEDNLNWPAPQRRPCSG